MIENEPRRSCFGYMKIKGGIEECSALKELYCKKHWDCPFYKKKKPENTRHNHIENSQSGKTFK